MKLKSRVKIFLTIDEQINTLKKRGLIIIDKEKLKRYLLHYSYHVLINGYNDPFWENYDRKTEKYRAGVDSNQLIELFEFDRKISLILISKIFNIERKISSVLSYVIIHYSKKEIKELETGEILKVKNEDFIKIFQRLKFENKKELNIKTDIEKIEEKIKNFKEIIADKKELKKSSKNFKDLEHYASQKNENNAFFLSESDIENIPIWTLSTKWTFGVSAIVFNNLSEKLKRHTLKYFFNNSMQKIEGKTCRNFGYLLGELAKTRNKICHNERIYMTNILRNSHLIMQFSKEILNINIQHQDGIKTHDLFKIIDKLDESKNSVLNGFYEACKLLCNFEKKSLEWIKIQLNLKQNEN